MNKLVVSNMQKKLKIPYGISNYETLVNEYIYIDRTQYIELLEERYRYIFFMRPRKFGKSLFLSMLDYYYNIKYTDKFELLFGRFYIGKQPTPMASRYLVMNLDFSRIETASFETTYQGFLDNVKFGAIKFYKEYPQFFNQEDIERVRHYTTSGQVIQDIITETAFRTPHKVYLLIDEYDHFANEILVFRYEEYVKMVGQNGFVRKFYEAIKVGTQKGVIDRLFVTGISPITLDSLTSGFNIATNITLRPELNEMLGFTKEEVLQILKLINIPENDLERVMGEMQDWYNGYKFNPETNTRVYNSNMVLYFAAEYLYTQKYPTDLLDPNIASDYNKVRDSFSIKDKEAENFVYLEQLVKTGRVESALIRLYNLERRYEKADFISLLFYQGIITISESDFDTVIFQMPNYVIKQLYFQYFHQLILERNALADKGIDVNKKIKELAKYGNIKPLVKHTEAILQELSTRDKMGFDEKYIKTIFTATLYLSKIFHIKNEVEVKKSKTEKGYLDLLLLKRPPFEPKFQFVIEFKYVKKQDAQKAKSTKEAAINQLKAYLKHSDYLQQLKDLKAYVIVFVGNKGEVIELN